MVAVYTTFDVDVEGLGIGEAVVLGVRMIGWQDVLRGDMSYQDSHLPRRDLMIRMSWTLKP